MKKLRVAVVGTGRLGGFHAQKLAAMPSVELIGVVDPVAHSRDRVAVDCRTQALASYELLLPQLDAVVIAAPTGRHHAIARDFLRYGIHTLVEKPICPTAAEADELVELARRAGVVLQVGHVERFNPAFTAALDRVGEPKYIEAVRAGTITFRSLDVGVVLDLMIHDLDLVLSMVRSPLVSVEALGVSVLGEMEDVANARLRFANGAVASLGASRVSYEGKRQMEIWSEAGFVKIDFADRRTTSVEPSRALRSGTIDVRRLRADELERLRPGFAAEHLPRTEVSLDAVDALALELADFVESIQSGRAPRVTGEAGRDAVAAAELILEQIAEHAWDGTTSGRTGALLRPAAAIVPAPHFHVTAPARRAG